jgi:hypothetical protein
MKILLDHMDQIHQLCLANQVKTLFAFGSVVTERFNADSDIDLVVDIEEEDPFSYSDKYFDVLFNLEDMLERPIDLLESRSLRNKYIKEAIEANKVLIYER